MELSNRIMDCIDGRSYSYISEISGVSASYISRIARGLSLNPDKETLIARAEAFDMSVSRLLKPIHIYTDNNILRQSTVVRNGETLVNELRVE